jgi:C4-dicarboxylate-specific signal transduction histidine kinase
MSFLGRDGGLVRGDAAARCSRSLASGPNTGATEVPTHRRASKLKSEPKSWYAPRLRNAPPAVIAPAAPVGRHARGNQARRPSVALPALLNLISNGFYAVTKRKKEIGSSDFEPGLSAATKNLGNKVEIRIRDNGTGIPAEVKEKIFNPFFTTKPAGEGTGLGLSMSHDIIVKQHGGRIDVETELGQFTEFRIVLPRTTATSKAGANG